MNLIIKGNPVTKKNHQEIAYKRMIIRGRLTKVPFIRQGKPYREYEARALSQIRGIINEPISIGINVKMLFYMESKRRVDLSNLEGSVLDILTRAGIILDDNSKIVKGHDGSRVRYDKLNPRVEITITAMEEDD